MLPSNEKLKRIAASIAESHYGKKGPATAAELRTMCVLYAAGVPIVSLAEQYKCSAPTIRELLRDLGVYERKAPMTDSMRGAFVGLRMARKSSHEIAELTGYEPEVVDEGIRMEWQKVKASMLAPYEDCAITARIHLMEDTDRKRMPQPAPQPEPKKKAPRVQRRTIDLDKPED